jgi:sodium transport system permease protein
MMGGMGLRQVWVLYRHEVRCALRERSVLVGSIVVPLVMYPLLLWALFAGSSFVAGQAERLNSRVAIHGLPERHRALADSLAARERITLTEWEGELAAAHREIAGGRLDVLAVFEPDPVQGAAGPGDNFRVVLAYSEARGRSEVARDRVEAVVASYRGAWVDSARRGLGIADAAWADYAVVRSDVATPDEIARFILAMLIPLLTLIMVALAAFYPAIDATAGERERSTWETLMTVAAPRESVVVAKYLYVATFAAVGGLLNLSALALSLGWLIGAAGPEAEALVGRGIPLSSLPIIGLGIALLGLFVAAAMLVFAVFARTFKEGQSMITPVYVAVFLPAIFIQSPDIAFTPALAALPVVNVALLIREVVLGTLAPLQGVITMVVMAACVVGAIGFARWILGREEVLLGTGEGGLWQYLRRRHMAGRRQA